MPSFTRRQFLHGAAQLGVYLQSGWLVGCGSGTQGRQPTDPVTGEPLVSNIGHLGPLGEPDRFGVRVPPGFTVRRVAAEGVAPGPPRRHWHLLKRASWAQLKRAFLQECIVKLQSLPPQGISP